MLGSEGDGLLQVGLPEVGVLAGDGEHEVEAEGS